MSTLKQAAQVDGQTISNLDPDMVITLDSHEGVQISSKTEDTITYKFLKEVDQDTEYKLNLTFVYKDQYKTVVPMTFLNKKPQPKFNLNLEWTTTDEEVIPAQLNALYFKVTNDQGNPVNDFTLKDIKAKGSPDNGLVVGGVNKNLALPETKDGVNAINVKFGGQQGTIDVDLVLSKDGFDFTIPTKQYKNPGSKAKVTFSVDKIFATDEPIDVDITVTKDFYLEPNKPVGGWLSTLTITGGMDDTVDTIEIDDQGKGKFKLTPNGKIEDIVLSGVFAYDMTGNVTPFSQTFKVEKDTLTVELLTDEDLGYLKKATVVAHVLNSKGEYLHQPGKIVNSTVTPVPANDVVTNVPGEFTQGTADTSIYTMIIDVGYLPGTVTIVPELTIAGVKYDITSKLEFKTKGSPVEVSRVNAVIDPFKNTMMGIYFTRQTKIDAETATLFGTKIVSQKSSSGLTIATPYNMNSKGNGVGYIYSEAPKTTQTLTFSVSEEIQGITYTYDDLVLEVEVKDGVKEEIIATAQAPIKIMEYDNTGAGKQVDNYLAVKFENTVSGPITEGVTLVSVKTTDVPEGKAGVFYVSNTLSYDKDGIYKLLIRSDKGIDSILFDMVVKVGSKEYTVKQFKADVVKPPLRLKELMPISMLPTGNGDVSFVFGVDQSNWTAKETDKPSLIYNSSLTFTFQNVTVSDNATLVTPPGSNADATAKFKLSTTATEGNIIVKSNVVASKEEYGDQGVLELTIPVGIAKELVMTPVTPVTLQQGTNAVAIDLKYTDDTPATGLNCYYYDYSNGIKVNNAYGGYSYFTEDKDKPGRYKCNIAAGWAEDSFTPIWYWDVDGLSREVKGPTFVLPGADPIITQTNDSITVDGQQHPTYFQIEVPSNPEFPNSGKDVLVGKCTLVSVDGPLEVVGDINRENSNGRFIINCKPTGEFGKATIKVKFVSTAYLTKYTREIDLPVSIVPQTPVLSDLVTEYTMDLWEEKELSYDVKSGDTSIASSVTDIVCTNNDDIKDDFEFSKNANGKWVFKSIKSDTSNTISKKAELKFIVVYGGVTTELPAEVNLSTNVNADPKPEFDVKII